MVAAQEFLRADPPDWVLPIEMPGLPDDLYRHIYNGEAFHLVDRQIRWQDDKFLIYSRIASEAANRSGLEAVSTFVRDFDPNVETMTLVRLDVIRDGERVSLRDDLDAELFRREEGLEAGIIDGTLSAYIQIPGIQIGDIVDAAVIWERGSYVQGDLYDTSITMEYGVPTGLTRLVATIPPDPALVIGGIQSGLNHEVQALASGHSRHIWTWPATPPRVLDDQVPPEYDPFGHVSFTAYSSWGAIGDALAPHYLRPYALTPEWIAKTDAIRAEFPTDEERAFAALRMVQEEIRYVGLEVGAGGYFARSPQTVTENHFGDCKDKALLLKTVLDHLDIPAVVALANMDTGHGIPARVPSLSAFNHMITGISLNDDWFWVDPTASFEAGLTHSANQPDYGWVLPVDGQGTGLVEIKHRIPERGSEHITETMTFTPFGMVLVADTKLTGSGAVNARRRWATTPVEDISRDYTKYYAERFPGLRATLQPKIEDDLTNNTVRILEYYLLPRTALDDPSLRSDFPFYSIHLFDRIPKVQISPRKDPLYLYSPYRLSHRIQVRNGPIEFEPPEDTSVSSPAFTHAFSGRAWEGGNMDLSWDTTFLQRVIPADQVAGTIKAARRTRDVRGWVWDLTQVEE